MHPSHEYNTLDTYCPKDGLCWDEGLVVGRTFSGVIPHGPPLPCVLFLRGTRLLRWLSTKSVSFGVSSESGRTSRDSSRDSSRLSSIVVGILLVLLVVELEAKVVVVELEATVVVVDAVVISGLGSNSIDTRNSSCEWTVPTATTSTRRTHIIPLRTIMMESNTSLTSPTCQLYPSL